MWECVHIPGYRQAKRDGRRGVPDRPASGRAAVSRGTASRRGEGSGVTAEGKGATTAQRPAPGRGGRPQGRRTFAPSKVQLRYFWKK